MAISIQEVKLVGGGTTFRMWGLSTDTKPMNAPNASSFVEMDTGKKFRFSAPESGSPQWYLQPSGGGGDETGPLSDEDIEDGWGA